MPYPAQPADQNLLRPFPAPPDAPPDLPKPHLGLRLLHSLLGEPRENEVRLQGETSLEDHVSRWYDNAGGFDKAVDMSHIHISEHRRPY